MNKCLICNSTKIKKINSKYLSFATKELYHHKTELKYCNNCEFTQRILTENVKKKLKEIYGDRYGFEVNNTHISLINGKPVPRNKIRAEFLKKYLKKNGLTHGDHLDVGGGDGQFCQFFKKYNKKWNTSIFEVSNKRKKQFVFKKFTKIYTENFDNIKKKFDLITFFHVLEHVHNPLEFIEKVKKMLKKNGIIFCIIPSYEKVNTDFFILEHLSFFNSYTLDQIFYKKKFEKIDFEKNNVLAGSEIGFIGKITEKYDVKSKVKFSETLINKIKKIKKKNIYIFGFGGTGISLGPQVKKFIKGYVDENESLYNKQYYGLKIFPISQIPTGSTIFVSLNNRIQSNSLSNRLKKKYKNINFYVP
jgi:SAM-dependent methyltransferase